MKKKIAIPVIILVGIIVIGLSVLWHNGYLDLHTPDVYEFGEEGSCLFDGDNLYYAVSEEGEVCIEGIRRVTDTVEIPETIDGKPVIELGYDMVSESQAKRLKNITVPDTVRIIHNHDIFDSKWYKNHPDGVVYIGKVAADYKGEAPENGVVEVKEGTEYIHENAFLRLGWEDLEIKQVILPEGLVEIGEHAFRDCYKLESINLPESLERLCGGVFEGCTSLKEISFPDKYISLSIGDFEGTAWLENQPKGLVYTGKSLIGYNGKKPQKIDLDVKEGTVEICGFDFDEFDALGYINVPASCRYIDVPDTLIDGFRVHKDNKHFSTDEMGNLYNKDKTVFIKYAVSSKNTEFSLPGTVTEIADYAFYHSNNLNKITLNKNVVNVDCNVLQCGRNIKEYAVEEGNSVFCAVDGNLYSKDKKELICYAGGKTDSSFTIPDTVVKVYDNAFSDCMYIEQIIVPESVKEFSYIYNCPKMDYSGIKTQNKKLLDNIEINQLDKDGGYYLVERETSAE